ncbi:MAG TPA: hypothetical protein VFX15_03415, partial [Actinomycetes bacterium]|nr:hypothetical protein [Actinomycetes bacterium]
ELWAQRATYADPVTLSQVVRDASGDVTDTLSIPGVPEPQLQRGLPAFIQTSLTEQDGTPI